MQEIKVSHPPDTVSAAAAAAVAAMTAAAAVSASRDLGVHGFKLKLIC
jgi:hypothetical protein